MGLTIKRIGFAVLVAAAVLLPLRRQDEATDSQSSTNRRLRLDTLAWRYRAAERSWSAFDLRDAAVAAAAMPPQGLTPAIVWRGFPAGAASIDADTAVAAFWRQLGTTRPQFHAVVMFFNAKAYKHEFYDGTYLNQQGDHVDCVAMAPAYQSSEDKPPFIGSAFRVALAPCALVAVFGAPGQGVRAWLESGRYSMAQTYGWFAAEKRPWRGGPWAEWSNTTSGPDWPSGVYDWMQYTGLLEIALTMRPPYQYGAAGMRCINGDEAACRTAFIHPGYTIPDRNRVPADLTLDDDFLRPSPTIVTTVRPPAPSLVATLVKEFGRDRFQKFWSSNQSLEAAFADAFGTSLSAWTARWANRSWLESYEAQHVNADIFLGATLKASWLPLTIAWSVLALAIAAMVAKRRTA